MKTKIKKLLATVLSVAMLFSTIQLNVFAEQSTSQDSEIITAIAPLKTTREEITVGSADLPTLPEELTVTLTTTTWEKVETTAEISVAVEWTLAKGETFSTEKEAEFVYTAKLIDDTLTIDDSITMPTLTVGVVNANTDENRNIITDIQPVQNQTIRRSVDVGAFTVTGGNIGTDYMYENGILKIKTETSLTIANIDPNTATSDRIVAESNVANLILNGVNIKAGGNFPVAFEVWNTANITLADGTTNTLESGKNWAGLQVIEGKTVTIGGKGTLTATGGENGAGIGGGNERNSGNITISDGTVNAISGYGGAGIGGGKLGHGGTIKISGGTVTANSLRAGSGIGGGYLGDGDSITISGGTVNASSKYYGAGIGGGQLGHGGDITISGGIVNANCEYYGAGIGGGEKGNGGNITISGTANVNTKGNAGIGGGKSGLGAEISITDAPTIIATGAANYIGLHDTNGIIISSTLLYADSYIPIYDGTSFTTGNGSSVIFKNQYVRVIPVVSKYTLIINNGSGDGVYAEGAIVNITADAAPKGQQFKNWTSNNSGTFADSTSATTTFTMPNGATTVTANYEDTLVSSIKIKSTNHKTEYFVDNSLDVTNLEITVTYSDGSTEDIAVSADMVTGFNSSAAVNNQQLIISYEGKNTSYTVNIVEAPIYDLLVEGGLFGEDYLYENGVLSIQTDTPLIIKNADINTATSDRIVTKSAVANITLNGVNISAGGSFPVAFEVWNTANITLADGTTNTLKSGENWAGLQVIEGKTVTIGGKGTLIATGVYRGAGIGGSYENNGGNIKIYDATVNATGGSGGAGIGGGYGGNGGNVEISGTANVTATSVKNAAGIGGGNSGAGGNITISGGTVTATGGSNSAGIGGSDGAKGGTVNIIDGEVNAKGGSGGAGIGSGYEGNSANITISGGTVTATGGNSGAGIGGGRRDGAKVTISGGTVTATGGYNGAGIGGGYEGNGGNVEISDTANVTAIGGHYSAGIGGGQKGGGGKVTISGGTVTASSTKLGTGIGGGYNYNGVGAEITITGAPTVIATGAENQIALHDTNGIIISGSLQYAQSTTAITDSTTFTTGNGLSVIFNNRYAKVMPADDPITTYELAVTNGTGSGKYAEGTIVNITANAAPKGQQFKNWTSNNSGIFADNTRATTTFTMPNGATTVTANYEDVPVSITSVSVNPTSESVQKGATKSFKAVVTGTGDFDDAVIWSVTGGTSATTIDTNGLLTVDVSETATSLTVTATANADRTKSATATVTITDIPVANHTITASAGTNGSISPSGNVSVNDGDNQTFIFTPDAGYEVDTVTVNGSAVAKANSYTFDNVSTNHTINVTFKGMEAVIIPQEISYANTTIIKTEGDGVFTNLLTQTIVNGNISYESSNPKVALVNDNGEVTIVGVGTATITATAEKTATHSEATISYALTVNTGEVNVDKNEVTIFDADFKDLLDVKITIGSDTTVLKRDGKYLIGYTDYTFNNGKIGEVNPGSIEITLYKEFIATLPEGGYSLAITTIGGTSDGIITGTIPAKYDVGGHGNPQTSVKLEDIKPSDWVYNYVNDIVDKGLFAGKYATTFSSKDNLMKVEMATILS